jgi:pilus assembly protein CpaB
MDKKKVALLLSALVIAALTAFIARSMFGAAPTPTAAAIAPPVPTGPQVLVATRALPVGTIITEDAMRFQPWPKELIEQAYILSDGSSGAISTIVGAAPAKEGPAPTKEGAAPAEQGDYKDLIGTVVRNPITAGQPISRSALVAPGDRGFLAAALSPGMRAISVSVSAKTGVAGFVFPGDRVDLFLTQEVPADFGTPMKVAETIIRNVRVLATDNRAAPTLNDKGQTVVSSYKLVTLEATPRMAEQITVAQSLGTLSLSLRAIADNESGLEKALAAGDVTIPKGASQEEEKRILTSIAARPSSGNATYSTGGDVSRFQRKSVPQIPTTAVQEALRSATTQKQVAKVIKGPVVNISRAGTTTEVLLDRR